METDIDKFLEMIFAMVGSFATTFAICYMLYFWFNQMFPNFGMNLRVESRYWFYRWMLRDSPSTKRLEARILSVYLPIKRFSQFEVVQWEVMEGATIHRDYVVGALSRAKKIKFDKCTVVAMFCTITVDNQYRCMLITIPFEPRRFKTELVTHMLITTTATWYRTDHVEATLKHAPIRHHDCYFLSGHTSLLDNVNVAKVMEFSDHQMVFLQNHARTMLAMVER